MWNKNFLLLWQGLAVSHIGTQLFSLALLYWILETTGSATLMGLVLMAAALPGVLLSPLAGTLVDNLSRKLILVVADILRGLACFVFVLSLWMGSTQQAIIALFFAQIVFGICAAVFNPAVGASLPEMIPKESIPQANSIIQGTNSIVTMLSFGIGGFMYAAIGAVWLFLINGISYLASAITECFITIRQTFPKERMTRSNALAKFKTETLEGFVHVWNREGLTGVMAMVGVVNFVIVPVGICIPIYVRDFLNEGPEFLGIMAASQAFGSLLGFICTGAIKTPAKFRATLILGSMASSGFVIILLGATTEPILTLPLVFVFGFLLPLINVNIISLIQGTTDSEIRGRVMGLLSTVVLGLAPISQGLSGFLIDAIDQQVPLIFFVTGGAFVSIIAFATTRSGIRDYLSIDYVNAPKPDSAG